MPRHELTSLDDPRLEPYRHLKDTNLTRWQGLLVAEGLKLVERLVASDCELVSVLVGRRYLDRVEPLLPERATLLVLPDDQVSRLVGFNFHHGALACARRPAERSAEQLAARCSPRSVLIVCPDVQDPENLGALFRSGAALGVEGVLLGPRAGDPFSRRVLRVSMGATLRMPWVVSRELARDLDQLRTRYGFELWATVLDGAARPLADCRRPDRLAVLFGSEGHGLERQWIDVCDRRVTIPMQPGVDSLNVAVAAGIVLYQALREA